MTRRTLVAALPLLTLLVVPGGATADSLVGVVQQEGVSFVLVDDDDSAGDIDITLGVDPQDGPLVAVQRRRPRRRLLHRQLDPGRLRRPVRRDRRAGFGGNDTIELDLIADGLPPLQGEAYGGLGNDTLRSPPDFRDVPQPVTFMEGDEGDDMLVSGNGEDDIGGGDGDDRMQSYFGADIVRGGPGNDSVSAGKEEPQDPQEADVLDGGPGVDEGPLVDADHDRPLKDMSVSLNGVADDGENGEGDNVIGVEKLPLTGEQVTVVGDEAANDFFVDADFGTLRGLGGDDRLVAYDGQDTIEGGEGNDHLEGGFGNDLLDGGGGVDSFSGDRTESGVFAVGNDEIRARDGNAEQIGCGIGGGDRAIVDFADVVSSDCEAVDRAGPPPPPPPPPPPGPPAPPPPGPNLRPGAPQVVGKLSIGTIASKGLVIEVPCPAACAVTAELRVDKATAKRLRLGRSRVLARGSRSRSAAGDARVTVKVVKQARKRFRRLRRAKVTLVTRTRVGGTTTPASRSLSLKR